MFAARNDLTVVRMDCEPDLDNVEVNGLHLSTWRSMHPILVIPDQVRSINLHAVQAGNRVLIRGLLANDLGRFETLWRGTE